MSDLLPIQLPSEIHPGASFPAQAPDLTLSDLENAREPVLISIGACAPTHFVGADVESALENAARWCSDFAPGLLTQPDYPEDCTTEQAEEAETDLTYADPGLWICSWEWTCRSLSLAELIAAKQALWENELDDETNDIHRSVMGARNEASYLDPENSDDPAALDVRLRVTNSCHWQILTGDPSYDQDHNGSFGAVTLDGSETDEECYEIAIALMEQAAESYAQSLALAQ